MCGIVGFLGEGSAKAVILNGLKKLEYRGYDSAGIAVLQNGRTERMRASGKLINLENRLKEVNLDGPVGIGHTRWATHGPPTENNAHPHFVDGVSIVHNGIIENYLEIKAQLKKEGITPFSDTDSELVAHLIAKEVKKTKSLLKAVLNVLPGLQGAFSIVVMWEGSPNELVAFKDGPPLVVGVGEKATYVVSDVQAAIELTSNFIYLEDREIVHIERNKIQVMNEHGKTLVRKPVHVNWDPETVKKQGFSHYMLKEIYEQPRALAAALEPFLNLETNQLRVDGFGLSQTALEKIEKVLIIGCGTSYYAGCVAEYLIENMAELSVEVEIASEFRYRKPVLNQNTLVLTISQSGETADTLAALRMVKEKSLPVMSLCNVKNSSIDREADGHLYMNSGTEIGVASTKAFMSSLGVLSCLALILAKIRRKLTPEAEEQMVRALVAAPSHVEVVLAYDKFFQAAAKKLEQYRGFLYMGRGINYPVAMEGALKMKELAYLHAEGYAAGEMKHGPLALIDENMAIVMLAPDDHLFKKTLSNMEEARARGGKVICIGSGENEKLREMSEHYLSLPKVEWMINPIVEVVPLQLMAFHLACHLGYDVDQPRNLAKSVTVE